MVRETGPPHMRTFVTKCVVGDIVTEGEGNGKKVSFTIILNPHPIYRLSASTEAIKDIFSIIIYKLVVTFLKAIKENFFR